MRNLFGLLMCLVAFGSAGAPSGIGVKFTPLTTNLVMNAPQDGWVAIWNNTAKKWSNAVNTASAANAIDSMSGLGTNTSLYGTIQLLGDIWATNGPVEIGQAGFPITFGSLGNGWLGTNHYTFYITSSQYAIGGPGTGWNASSGSGFIINDTGSLSLASDAFIHFTGEATPTLTSFGDLSFDNNAWAASRGALAFNDGSSTNFIIATVASDAPANGQSPLWNTGGTITWETPASIADLAGIIARAITNEDTRAITLYSTITDPNAFYLNAGIAYVNNRRAPESDGFNTNYVIPLYEAGEDEWYIIMTNHVHFRSFSNGIQNPAYRGFAGVTLTNFTATDKTLSFTNTWIPLGTYPAVVPAGKTARVEFEYDAGGVPRYSVQLQDYAPAGSGGGGPGSLAMNANQFDTNAVVSIIDGALTTNLVSYTTFHIAGVNNGRLSLQDTNGTTNVVFGAWLNGAVGIGTNNPQSHLHVRTADTNDLAWFDTSAGQVVRIQTNRMVLLYPISSPTNVANFTITTNDFVSGLFYTNVAQRASAAATISITNVLSTDFAKMALWVDQDGDGTFEMQGRNVSVGGVALVAATEVLWSRLQPGARFCFTNQSGGTATATIVPNSSDWTKE